VFKKVWRVAGGGLLGAGAVSFMDIKDPAGQMAWDLIVYWWPDFALNADKGAWIYFCGALIATVIAGVISAGKSFASGEDK